MKPVIGKKLGMTQFFSPEGVVLPVTEIAVWPVTVTQLKNATKDGYEAVQVAGGQKKNLTKPVLGHLQGKKFRHIKEFRMPVGDLQVGDSWGTEVFTVGEKVRVIGISKGKGFQGVVKRWGFAGSPASHGHKDQLRMPGSIGATGPARVFKGTRMGGHMGSEQVTAKWLEVVKIDQEKNSIFIKGAIPGARNGVVYIISEAELKLNNTNDVNNANNTNEDTNDTKIDTNEDVNEENIVEEPVKEESTPAVIEDNKPEDK